MLKRQQIVKHRGDALDYIHAMLGQLQGMAAAEGCDMLAYLIEMAYLEATDVMRAARPLRIRKEERNGPA